MRQPIPDTRRQELAVSVADELAQPGTPERRLTSLRRQQRVHRVAVQKVIQRRIGQLPAVRAVGRVILEPGRGELPPHQRRIIRVGQRVATADRPARCCAGPGPVCRSRSAWTFPLALSQVHHLVGVAADHADLIEDRQRIVQALKAFRLGRQALKRRAPTRHPQLSP